MKNYNHIIECIFVLQELKQKPPLKAFIYLFLIKKIAVYYIKKKKKLNYKTT